MSKDAATPSIAVPKPPRCLICGSEEITIGQEFVTEIRRSRQWSGRDERVHTGEVINYAHCSCGNDFRFSTWPNRPRASQGEIEHEG